MQRRRTMAGLLVGVACASVAACTSSGSTPKPAPSTTASSRPAASGSPVAASPLAARVRRGLADASSVHLRLSTAVADSSTIGGAGTLALHAGTISAADIVETLPGGLGTVRLVVADGRTYARLPAGFGSRSKPWTLLSRTSRQPLVAELASVVSSVLAVASPSTVVTFIDAASSVRGLGAGTVDGTAVQRYQVVIPAAKLDALPGGLSAGSASSVPVDLDLDSSGRPVRVAGALELNGARVAPVVTLSDYGKPVSISPPARSQIAS